MRVSRLALGTAVLGLAPPEDGVDALIGAALDAGINLFDCANTYGSRPSFDREGLPAASERKHAEELLGKALKSRRDEVVLCTKVSEPVGTGPNDGGMIIRGLGGKGGGLSRYHIMREVEQSLRRLDTDHIDIYHLHHPDLETAIEETLRATDDLIRQGKVRYVGLSTYNGWQLTQAVMTADHLGLARPILNQVPYSLVNRWPEAEAQPAAVELGLSLTCFSPLAGGALAGAEVMDRQYRGAEAVGDALRLPAGAEGSRARAGRARPEVGPQARPFGLGLAALAARGRLGDHRPGDLGRADSNAGVFDLDLDDAQIAEIDAIGTPPMNLPI